MHYSKYTSGEQIGRITHVIRPEFGNGLFCLVEHQAGCPVNPGIVAQLGQYDRSSRTGGECCRSVVLADYFSQRFTGLRYAAADYDDLRIRYGCEHAESRSEIFGKFIDNAVCDSIAFFIRVKYSPGIEIAQGSRCCRIRRLP